MALSAAGPALQILLGVVVWWSLPHAANLTPQATYEDVGMLRYFLHTLMMISLFWAVLNLLPVLPLDGGRILEALLGPRQIRTTLWISIVVSLVCGWLMFNAYGSMLFAIFMGFFAWQAWKALAALPRS